MYPYYLNLKKDSTTQKFEQFSWNSFRDPIESIVAHLEQFCVSACFALITASLLYGHWESTRSLSHIYHLIEKKKDQCMASFSLPRVPYEYFG